MKLTEKQIRKKESLAAKKWSRIDSNSQKKRKAAKDKALAEKKVELWELATDGSVDGVAIARPCCMLCAMPILKFEDCAICHVTSRGLGGGKRNDLRVFLGHHRGNVIQASMSLEAYFAKYSLEQRRKNCQGMA